MIINRWEYVIFLVFVLVAVFVVQLFNGKIEDVKSRLRFKIKRYEKVCALVRRLESRGKRGKMYGKDITFFVRYLERSCGLKGFVVSSRTFESMYGRGLHLKLSGLTLDKLVKLVEEIESLKDVKLVQLVVRKSFAKPNRLDVEIKVRKTTGSMAYLE